MNKKHKSSGKPSRHLQAAPSPDSLKKRLERLIYEARRGGDEPTVLFYTALRQAMSLSMPDVIKEANLILLIDQKLAD